MRAYYEETVKTFAKGMDIDVDAYEARSFAIFREFARANGMNEAGMLDHLKLIPRQVVGIVKENPAVLKTTTRSGPRSPDRIEALLRLPVARDLGEQLGPVEIHLVAADLACSIQLHQAHADDLERLRADRDLRQPLVEEAVLHRNRFELRPHPVRIVREELAEVREQLGLAARAGRNAGIDVQRIVGIERGEALRIVAGPGGQPALRELLRPRRRSGESSSPPSMTGLQEFAPAGITLCATRVESGT